MDLSVEQFAEACEKLANLAASDLQPAFADVEQIVRMGIEDNFDNQSTADGNAWPPRKKPGDGHPLLIESGALKAAALGRGEGSVSRIAEATMSTCELQIGVEAVPGGPGGIPGARRHQYGDTPPGIRAREFIGISDETLDFVCERVGDELLSKLF